MDTNFIHKQVAKMTTGSFSALEHHRYKTEKMLLRQFILKKLDDDVPAHISVEDMKSWLFHESRFLDEFQDIAKLAEPRKLLLAELTDLQVWTCARKQRLTEMEAEIQREFMKEQRLSERFGREVTVEGIDMFLSDFRHSAEQTVKLHLRLLQERLLSFFTTRRLHLDGLKSRLIGFREIIRTLVPQITDTALEILLNPPCYKTHHRGMKMDFSLDSALSRGVEADGARIGKKLGDVAVTCLYLPTIAARDHLRYECKLEAQDMIKAVYMRAVVHATHFHLMDFDNSSVYAGTRVTDAIHDMEEKAQRAAAMLALRRHGSQQESRISELLRVGTTEATDQESIRVETRKEKTFFRRVGTNLKRVFNKN